MLETNQSNNPAQLNMVRYNIMEVQDGLVLSLEGRDEKSRVGGGAWLTGVIGSEN